ncbi:leucine-rich repeat domain-containing protein, partial [Bombiscardovia coagulans]
MSMKRFIQSTRVRIVAVVVSVAMAVAGLVVWDPVGLYAQAAGGSGQCVVGTSKLEDCFDPTIEDAISSELSNRNLPSRPDDVFNSAMAQSITKLAADTGIRTLNGLETLTNLQELHVTGGNSFTDLTPILGLPNLTKLDVSGNSRFDTTTFNQLSAMTNLTSLNVSTTGIPNLHLLDNMSHLVELDISSNKTFTDFQPLVDRHQGLEVLNISNNNIGVTEFNAWRSDKTKPASNIAWIKDLTNLKELKGNSNSIQDLSGLEQLHNLKNVEFDKNLIVDITPLYGVIDNLTSFSIVNQRSYYPDFILTRPGEKYSLHSAIINSGTHEYAEISAIVQQAGGAKSSTDPHIAEWASPKVGRYSLSFEAKNIKGKGNFQGTVNQNVLAKVEFLDEAGNEITTTEPGATPFPTQITNGGTPSTVTFPKVSKPGYTPCWKIDTSKADCIPESTVFDSITQVHLGWVPNKYTVFYDTQLPGVTP